MATSSVSPLAVELEGITKRFSRTWALRGVAIRVAAGESVCLLGPNGSGKTTLLRILATATRPSGGRARIFGYETRADGDEVRERVGLLSHRTFLYGELTALENLRFAAGMCGLRITEPNLHRALEEVGLDHAAGRRVRGFSQGMIQRLALARATLHQPPLLLLDEPYSALDVGALQLLDRFLERFVAGGGTMIVVTHQIERGLVACKRAIAINAGRLVSDVPSTEFVPPKDWD